jgi:hypothetical protein
MSNQAGVEWPAGGRAAERACVAHRAQVLIFLRRRVGVMFMRVNVKCAHHMRSPLGRMEQRSPVGAFATAPRRSEI